MAKISCNFMEKIKKEEIQSLQNPIVFVVDMINGFAKEGSLSDPGILDIVSDIQNLLNQVSPSIFICDGHDLDSKEFASFPVHCIKGTEESEVIDELLPYVKNKFYKNSTNAFVAKEIQSFIETNIDKYQDIVITGCCTDICILQFALALNTYLNENDLKQQRVITPINMMETYDIEGIHGAMKYNEMACLIMQLNGIHVVELI